MKGRVLLDWANREAPEVSLIDEQREALAKLWFKYGHNRQKPQQHKWIQGLLERGKDFREQYLEFLDPECIEAVDEVLKGVSPNEPTAT